MTYGYCPRCTAPATWRARNPIGPTTCANGHQFPHADTLNAPRTQPMNANREPAPNLRDGMIDIVNHCRLTRADLPDDFDWLLKAIEVEPPKDVNREYGTLRVALRNAILRVYGAEAPEVSQVFRNIEAGMDLGDATDALEAIFRTLRRSVIDDYLRTHPA